MRGGRSGLVLEPLRTLFGAGTAAGLTDEQLLARFTLRRDDDAEAAFAALVARHGPMVRRVCRSLLDDPNDAEDVFQATFLVLARKAGTIRRPELLGNWLYGTAHRTARTLKTRAARRFKHEAREAAMAQAEASTDPDALERRAICREEATIVHQEVARLPEVCRAAVVLCDLAGWSQEEAARELRCSERTLRRRLGRARDLLRARLTRRGLDPTASRLAVALGPELVSAAIPQINVDATTRAAIRFAAGRTIAGTVPAAATALAEGVITAMFWTKLKGIAIASSVFLVIGVGAGLAAGMGFAAQDGEKRGESKSVSSNALKAKRPSPADQFRELVVRYDDAMAAYQKLGEKAKTQAETQEIYKDRTLPQIEFNPQFLALAERYPNDPIAVDALVWIVDKTMTYWDSYDRPATKAIGRAYEILARDHPGDARLGPLCLKLVNYPSPRRDTFLRAVAERSPDRVVRGRAILALAQYLKMKGELVEILKEPTGAVAQRLREKYGTGAADEKTLRELYGPDYLGQLRAADSTLMLRESDRLFARVFDEYGDVAYVHPYDQPTRETLADVAHRERRPGPVTNPGEQLRTMDDTFRSAVKAADRAEEEARKKAGKAEPDDASVRAYIAAYPKWRDYGPKMWRLAQDSPRHPAAFDALIWLVEHGPRFFDSLAVRDAVMSEAVDTIIRDHLESIAEHLTDRNVAMALNAGDQLPTPYRERLFRALFERGRDRNTRGLMGLALGRYLKVEADFVEILVRRALGLQRRIELLFLNPAFVDQLRTADHVAIARRAEEVLEQVITKYGDLPYVNGMVATTETLADVAKRELSEIRTLSVGKTAPEITGEDVYGQPMTLSEFRGKVVLLDFGSHEHCGGCKTVYPRLRATLKRLRGRPFVILGINSGDNRDVLKQATAQGEITWRCWRDGEKPYGTGPIVRNWNIGAFPTFFLIDHRGVLRPKADLHPFDTRSFDDAIEGLLKEAEARTPDSGNSPASPTPRRS
jgi:RNA polymerase sigma factor (sigma-70 family)